MHDEPPLLFNQGHLASVLMQQVKNASALVNQLDPNDVLHQDEAELLANLVGRLRVAPLSLHTDRAKVDQMEIRLRFGRSRVEVPGVEVRVDIPFEGDPALFNLCPSNHWSSLPNGEVRGNTLVLRYPRQQSANQEEIKRGHEDNLRSVEQYVASVNADVQTHNANLSDSIRTSVRQRKERLLANQSLAASLGLPLKRRDHTDSLMVPIRQKAPPVELPKAVPQQPKPEWALKEEDYQNILRIMQNVSLAMERSPHTFAKLKEEEIRDIFLIFLNGHYEGQATGETFNISGKTDILIRLDGKAVFIAECAIWHGEETLAKKLDQLLPYVGWRDTKTAMLLYCRNKDFTAVLKKIPGTIGGHPNFKKALQKVGDSQFSFLMRHKDDPDREFVLTVMAFHIPSP